MRHSDPSSPRTWMTFAYSDLSLSRAPVGDEVLLETLCFHAQQAVEKALKAVLVSRGISFPKTHSIEVLIDLLPHDIPRTPEVLASAELSEFATTLRYPGVYEPVSPEEYHEAIRIAEAVVEWAESMLTTS